MRDGITPTANAGTGSLALKGCQLCARNYAAALTTREEMFLEIAPDFAVAAHVVRPREPRVPEREVA